MSVKPPLYRIVVIDDDPIIRKLFRKLLTAEGCECVLAEDAASGLKLCAEQKPDLILLDVHLQDGNGIEVCRAIKEDAMLRHIPVVIVTGEAFSIEERVDGLEAGAEDYVLKPFNPAELMARIKGILKTAVKPTGR